MEANWYIIVGAVVLGIVLILFLIRQNQRDEKDVERNFNDRDNIFHDEDSELNNEQ